jgi:hypothetical protein
MSGQLPELRIIGADCIPRAYALEEAGYPADEAATLEVSDCMRARPLPIGWQRMQRAAYVLFALTFDVQRVVHA